MTLSLAEFVPEINALYTTAKAAGNTSVGAWVRAYTFIFGLISVDAQGHALLSRGHDAGGIRSSSITQGSP